MPCQALRLPQKPRTNSSPRRLRRGPKREGATAFGTTSIRSGSMPSSTSHRSSPRETASIRLVSRNTQRSISAARSGCGSVRKRRASSRRGAFTSSTWGIPNVAAARVPPSPNSEYRS